MTKQQIQDIALALLGGGWYFTDKEEFQRVNKLTDDEAEAIAKGMVEYFVNSIPDADSVPTAAHAEALAQNYQASWPYYEYSYGELADWQELFRELGEKFDLLEDFQENCIC